MTVPFQTGHTTGLIDSVGCGSTRPPGDQRTEWTTVAYWRLIPDMVNLANHGLGSRCGPHSFRPNQLTFFHLWESHWSHQFTILHIKLVQVHVLHVLAANPWTFTDLLSPRKALRGCKVYFTVSAKSLIRASRMSCEPNELR